ncbi:hypothetical protein ACFL56_03690, partial [Candidatus Margulisiibacteriota bacterium]
KNIVVNDLLEEAEFLKKGTDKNKLRLVELLLFLKNKNYIKINSCAPIDSGKKENTKTPVFEYSITFKNKSILEIKDIEINWEPPYGDLKLNKVDEIIYYKNKPLLFNGKKATNAKKILIYLLKNPGKRISIKEVFLQALPDDLTLDKHKKRVLGDYAKAIRKRIGITNNPDSELSISLPGENIILLSNPIGK